MPRTRAQLQKAPERPLKRKKQVEAISDNDSESNEPPINQGQEEEDELDDSGSKTNDQDDIQITSQPNEKENRR
ncbi:hypothetical protein PtA15_3A651 [Puccinia triticina]|uniref:Histone chaperone domain-containing protein n=1 Tax=Puccinia triticina TaxID=208348 RepID=A0ABY7CH54_9BASI|nr:uncharacterized protein PtA15_3A651 [Puccinia triticina]WAQ83282.1 hypothetical protein PtA15_3A651 [Puccinia triticina]